ncbi:unnamed protein product [Paramecium primaurelia]|uniref:Uncharacterized protein n=1 Tax=Paramecium primaurelia TaxID=5886 RepID=A0A8S1M8H3_PARPR|nr:unnamed protein product [Paramecium primaurelia]
MVMIKIQNYIITRIRCQSKLDIIFYFIQLQQNSFEIFNKNLNKIQNQYCVKRTIIKKHPSQQALLTYSHRKKLLPSKKSITKEDSYNLNHNMDDYSFKVTQSQPFNFDKKEKEHSISIKERKLQEMLDEMKRNNSFKSFKAKEIAQIVEQVDLYEKIFNDNEKKKRRSQEKQCKNYPFKMIDHFHFIKEIRIHQENIGKKEKSLFLRQNNTLVCTCRITQINGII